MTGRRGSTGFSLLELVVVLAIFAMVALIGAQAIRATVQTDARLSALSADNADLARALALLRRDLAAGVAMPFHGPAGGITPALAVASGGTAFQLSVTGLGVEPPGLGRVEWRHDGATNTLRRQVWLTLTPGDQRAAGPDQAVLTGVTDLALFSFGARTGWQPGFAVDPRNPNALPRGLRVRIGHDGLDQLDVTVRLP